MRTLLCLLLCTLACHAQTPEDQILAVYKQMEKAEQTGDANTWISLWSRASAPDAESMRPYVRPRPDRHYTSSKVFVQGDEAVLLGQSGKEDFLSVRFVREDGRWKIRDQVGSNTPYHADSVYAIIPPAAGAFARAGSPWPSIAPAFNAADAASHGWQVRAIYDESFFYVRIESSAPIPAPGTQAETPPGGWPVMKVAISGVGEFVLHASANIGDKATFDENGRANSHFHFVTYALRLERNDQAIFQVFTDSNPEPLVQAGDHFFDVRVPLRTLGIANAKPTKIIIGDAQWPQSALFTVEVQPYR